MISLNADAVQCTLPNGSGPLIIKDLLLIKQDSEADTEGKSSETLPNKWEEEMTRRDFPNAFNTLRRDYMIQMMSSHVPELHHLVSAAYGTPSDLFSTTLCYRSSTGVQQGEPLALLAAISTTFRQTLER